MIDIDAIRARVRATSDPWFWLIDITPEQHYKVFFAKPPRDKYQAGNDFDFVKAAKTDVFDLCDEVERLQACEAGIEQMQLQIDRLSEENESLKGMAVIGASHIPGALGSTDEPVTVAVTEQRAMESLAKTEIAREEVE